MKLGILERLCVNGIFRHVVQRPLEFYLFNRMAPFPKGAHMLDLGCGNGGTLAALRRYQPASLTGVDADPAHLARARAFLARRRISAQLVEADPQSVKLPAHTFDVVTSLGTLRHLPEWPEALAESARLLRHGGMLYIGEFYAPFLNSPLTHTKLLNELPKHGFTILSDKHLNDICGLTVARLTGSANSYD